jgi:hypothetical protein
MEEHLSWDDVVPFMDEVKALAPLQALRAAGEVDPQVLSLVALHWARPPDPPLW